MGYVETLLQQGLEFVDSAPVKPYADAVRPYVEKVAAIEQVDAALGFVAKHAPAYVELVDKHVDPLVDSAIKRSTESKEWGLEQVGKVQELKSRTLERKDDAIRGALEQKDALIARAQAKREELAAVPTIVVEQATCYYTGASGKKNAIMQQVRTRTQDTPLEKVAEYVLLMADAVLLQGDSLVRKSLTMPMTLKERMEASLPALEASRAAAKEFGLKLYRPVTAKAQAMLVIVVDLKNGVVRMASREFLVPKFTAAQAAIEAHARALLADPSTLPAYGRAVRARGVQGLELAKTKASCVADQVREQCEALREAELTVKALALSQGAQGVLLEYVELGKGRVDQVVVFVRTTSVKVKDVVVEKVEAVKAKVHRD